MAVYSKKKIAFVVGNDTYELDPELDVAQAIANKANRSEVPTKTSQLQNDSGFGSLSDTIMVYKTLSDLGLSGSTASLADIYNAMAFPSISLLQGNVIDSSDMPGGVTAGYVKIEKSTSARSRIFYYSKLDVTSDCFMALTNGNVPTGTWVPMVPKSENGTYGNSANPITDLADLPLYSCGNVTLAASLSPTGASIFGAYIKAGTSSRYAVIFVGASSTETRDAYIAKVYDNSLQAWEKIVTDRNVDMSSSLASGQNGITLSNAFLKRSGNVVKLGCTMNNSTAEAITIPRYSLLVTFAASIGLPSEHITAIGMVSGDNLIKDFYVSKYKVSEDTTKGQVMFADTLTIPANGFAKIDASWIV